MPVSVNRVESTHRSTNIKVGEKIIHTVEHLMSALAALSIDQIIIELEGEELPILDGSALPFYQALVKAGIHELEGDQEVIECKQPFRFDDPESDASYVYEPNAESYFTAVLDYGDPFIGEQIASCVNFADYEEAIAGARTFVFVEDLEKLHNAGLIKGGSFDNALVFAKKNYDQTELNRLAKIFNIENTPVSSIGLLNGDKLTFSNEPARHKLLDFIGDTYLMGKRIKGKLTAFRPSHAANVRFTKELSNRYRDEQRNGAPPLIDVIADPVMDHQKIKTLLPHRYPFLLVDKVLKLTETEVIAIKQISGDQFFFPGHFPDNPVFPGVLQMEALAQAGGILALSTVPDPENYDTYFLKMDNVRFKKIVRPGDTLLLHMNLLSPIRRGIVHMQGYAFVGSDLVSEGELTARIQKRTTQDEQ